MSDRNQQPPPRLHRGLWVILATPFTDAGDVDHGSLARQVRFARESGADGLVALGVFGEAAALSLAEQRAVVSTVVAEAGDVPLVLGLAGRTTAVALEQAATVLDIAEGARSTSLMVQIHASDLAVVAQHLGAIHAATGAGIVLQDYPVVSGVRMSSGTIAHLARQCPWIVAVKAEAPPTPVAIGELTAATDVPVFGGLGGLALVDELAMGAAGAMTGFSHPEGLRRTLDAFAAGGFAAARAQWAPWLPLATFEQQQGIALALRKMLLHRRGILDHPTVRPPAPPMPQHLSALLDQHLSTAPTQHHTGEH